jgi:soluble lytic murein transglycosylase-like protein
MGWIWILLAGYWAAASPGRQSAPAGQQQASLAMQRASIKRQAQNLQLWMAPWSDGPPEVAAPATAPPACDRIGDEIVAPLIDGAAKAHAVEPKLIRAVIEQESGFRPCAVSPKGAQGLMQLMPETARELAVSDPFDAGQSVEAGAKYLKQLLDRYKGDVAQALAAYNAGAGAVDQSGGIPDIPETRSYVNAILEKLGIKPAGGGR